MEATITVGIKNNLRIQTLLCQRVDLDNITIASLGGAQKKILPPNIQKIQTFFRAYAERFRDLHHTLKRRNFAAANQSFDDNLRS